MIASIILFFVGALLVLIFGWRTIREIYDRLEALERGRYLGRAYHTLKEDDHG